jgi:hypothetical protein
MAAPGVVVSTATRSGPTGIVRAKSGQYFVIGITERGPVDGPVKINSMTDYKRTFGDRVAYGTLYDDLSAFFECGGTQAYVLRAVGTAATAGSLSVNDTSAAPTVKFDAASAGAWSTRITVQVDNGTNGATTRKVTIRLDGQIVQSYDNLTSPAQIAARFVGSPYVKATDLGSPTVAPGNLPIVTAATPLSAGTDDRATVNAALLTTQLDLMKVGYGDGAVAAPGFGETMHAALIEHARTHRRLALLTTARGTSVDDLIVASLALGSTAGSEDAGLFGPWIQVSDGAGGVRVISPEGFVAAARSKAHDSVGPWASAAGEGSISTYVLGIDQEFSRDDAERLDTARINPIRVVAGKIRLYGWRSLSANETDYASLTVADLLNRLVTECEARLEPFVFKTIDGRGQLLSQMKGVLVGVLEPIRSAGGIFEAVDPSTNEVVDSGYSVTVDSSLNTPESLALNRVQAQVAVRPSPNAALINLTIVKAGLTAAV